MTHLQDILPLMDSRGNLLDFADFCHKYNLICSGQQYSDVVIAIPQALICTVKGSLLYTVIIALQYSLAIQNCFMLTRNVKSSSDLRYPEHIFHQPTCLM